MTLENKEGRQDGALEACNAEAAKHEASEQLNVFDKGRMEGPDADSTTHGTVPVSYTHLTLPTNSLV